jgi:hypothetical protein
VPQPPVVSPAACGFHRVDGTVASIADVRRAIANAAKMERAKWFVGGAFEKEGHDSRFGDLVRYWLAGLTGKIHPGKLELLQAAALDPSIVYDNLTNTTLKAAITRFAAAESLVNTKVKAVYTAADNVDLADAAVALSAGEVNSARARVTAATTAEKAAATRLASARGSRSTPRATLDQALAAFDQAKAARVAAATALTGAVARHTTNKRALATGQKAAATARDAASKAKTARSRVDDPATRWSAADRKKVRTDLLTLAASPDPQPVNAEIDAALQAAHNSRADVEAWSAAFVCSCVRAAAISLQLEGMSGSVHFGKDRPLFISRRHSDYVIKAHEREKAADGGTYHAFAPGSRAVQVSDVIVTDREDFIRRPRALPAVEGAILHGDIVTELGIDSSRTPYAEAIGGNVGHAVRRRRYPLDASGQLLLDAQQLFIQEDDAGRFPTFQPLPRAPRLLAPMSTRRSVALLSLVETCSPAPSAARELQVANESWLASPYTHASFQTERGSEAYEDSARWALLDSPFSAAELL